MKELIGPFIPSVPLGLMGVWFFLCGRFIGPRLRQRAGGDAKRWGFIVPFFAVMFIPTLLILYFYGSIVDVLFRILGK